MAGSDLHMSAGHALRLAPFDGLGWYIDGANIECPAVFTLQVLVANTSFIGGIVDGDAHILAGMQAILKPLGGPGSYFYFYADTDMTLLSRALSGQLPIDARVAGFVRKFED